MKKKIKDVENLPAVVAAVVVVAVLGLFLTGREALTAIGVFGKTLPEETKEITTIAGDTLNVSFSRNDEGRFVYTFTAKDMTMKEFQTKYKLEKFLVEGFEVSEENGIEKINIQDDKIDIVTVRRAKYPNLTKVGIVIRNLQDNRTEKLDFKLLVEE